MKKYIIIIFLFLSISALSQDISGSWFGEIDIRGNKLNISFHLTKTEKGYESTMDIPEQGVSKIKGHRTIFKDSVLNISFPNFKINYKGKLNGQNEIIGNFIQSSYPISLNLIKGEIKINRPQEPQPPFIYQSENVRFKNTIDNIYLTGTITLPRTKDEFPIVIIISGSGPQDRDGEMFGHKPYYVIADHLTKNGIGVLRFDERGVGESEGNFETATINTFVSDIKSAIKYLNSRNDINFSKIGLIGHSIGGIVSTKVAIENKDVSFIALLAAPGIDGDKLMLLQKANLERMMGLNETQIAQGQDLMRGAYDLIIESNELTPILKDSINSYLKIKYGQMISENQRNSLVQQITSNEMVSLLKSKPKVHLEEIKCPVLAINGSKDFQVVAKENLNAIKNALEKNGNKSVKIVELKNLNHLFQECKTGAIDEYYEIEQTFSPNALAVLMEWIIEQNK